MNITHRPCLDPTCDGGCFSIRRCAVCGEHPAAGCGYACERVEAEEAGR